MKILKKIKTKQLKTTILKNVSKKTYNKNAVFDDKGLQKDCGIYKFLSDEGNTGLVGIKHTPSFGALKRIASFAKAGGKLVYLPMLAGIPLPEEVSMYSIIGHATLKPAEYLRTSRTINLSATDFLPIGRFHPMPNIEKNYDFFIVTWAGDIKRKRWDLVVQSIEDLCPEHKLCVLAYKGVPSNSDLKIINDFVNKGNLTFINNWVSKEEFPILMNSSKVLIVSSEWDNHPRIMDQALLCNVPLAVNENIYGGYKLINNSTGILSPPQELAHNARTVLDELAGKVETRKWYLENHGPYNATIKLTACINEVFGTKFKMVYEQEREFMFEEDYMEKSGIPQSIQNYFRLINERRRMGV